MLSDPDLSESEESVVSSPIKRRRQTVDEKSPRTPRAVTDQDELDIEEDIRDLQDSGIVTKFLFHVPHSHFH